MKRRKHATYRCLGAGCVAQARLRVSARRLPKLRPPMWRVMWTRAQDADGGTLREASIAFCSDACLSTPQESGGLAAALHRYLGAPGAPPAVATYRCLTCEATAELNHPQHRNNLPHLPQGWVGVPLIAVDYESGIHRCTTVPACSDKCLKDLDSEVPADEQPERIRTELARVLADVTSSEEDLVIHA